MRRESLTLALVLGAYFALQVLLRIWIGTGLQLDEAELVMRAQEFHWGYGPQLPLFNWLQFLTFKLMGVNVAALAIAKNACLWLGYLLAYLALARFVQPGRAAIATVGLILLPEIAWEAQRTLSHSVALILSTSAFLFALFGAARNGRWRDWIALGVIIGFGGLSKYNFWILPFSTALALWILPPPRGWVALSWGRIGAAAMAALAILAGPVLWIAQHPDIAFASASKIRRSERAVLDLPFLGGVAETLQGYLLALILAGLIALLARLWPRGGAPRPLAEANAVWLRKLLLAISLIGCALIAVMMGVADATRVTPRWLIPLAMPGALGLMLWALEAGTRRAGQVIATASGIVGIAVTVGIFVVFGLKSSRLSYDFAPLRAEVSGILAETASPGIERLTGAGWLMGSLALLEPDWPVKRPPPLGPALAPASRIVQLRASDDGAAGTPPQPAAVLEQSRLIRVPDRIDPREGMGVSLEVWRLP
ncbi:glycosyltransferase family 39 protein [Sinirhodobacter sp. WL0062]|uniref:Glycosyltransferase family 39 protein n=1 Tax=Rhodobacter flavimaris TaxID=2907145 RepID=A0ABS8Z1Q4_9RHOB|nr:glycosyltransferase family 39 protein [Sinirhodobacter sp. WL0062]MCE5973865.1 glycosyltransferase family 39 protein [Sinirhodobacter sp. WL0062]